MAMTLEIKELNFKTIIIFSVEGNLKAKNII